MDLIRIHSLRYKTPVLRARVEAACVEQAVLICKEAANTPSHTIRLKWANDVLRGRSVNTDLMMWPVALDSIINTDGESSSDANVRRVVADSVNKIAILVYA